MLKLHLTFKGLFCFMVQRPSKDDDDEHDCGGEKEAEEWWRHPARDVPSRHDLARGGGAVGLQHVGRRCRRPCAYIVGCVGLAEGQAEPETTPGGAVPQVSWCTSCNFQNLKAPVIFALIPVLQFDSFTPLTIPKPEAFERIGRWKA